MISFLYVASAKRKNQVSQITSLFWLIKLELNLEQPIVITLGNTAEHQRLFTSTTTSCVLETPASRSADDLPVYFASVSVDAVDAVGRL